MQSQTLRRQGRSSRALTVVSTSITSSANSALSAVGRKSLARVCEIAAIAAIGMAILGGVSAARSQIVIQPLAAPSSARAAYQAAYTDAAASYAAASGAAGLQGQQDSSTGKAALEATASELKTAATTIAAAWPRATPAQQGRWAGAADTAARQTEALVVEMAGRMKWTVTDHSTDAGAGAASADLASVTEKLNAASAAVTEIEANVPDGVGHESKKHKFAMGAAMFAGPVGVALHGKDSTNQITASVLNSESGKIAAAGSRLGKYLPAPADAPGGDVPAPSQK